MDVGNGSEIPAVHSKFWLCVLISFQSHVGACMHLEVRDPTSFLQGEGRVENRFKVEECFARSGRHSTK